MRAVTADPKTDYALKRFFGAEAWAAWSLALREGEERGEERGEKRGEMRGLKKGLIIAIQTLVFGIEFDAAREEALAGMSPEELEALRVALLADRRWPEGD